MTQLRDFDRYVMYVEFGTNDDVECLLGYWLPNGQPTESIWVGVTFYSNPKSRLREGAISAFRDFAKNNEGWKDENLDDEKEWASIFKGTGLQTFMAQADHIKAVEDYFLTLLSDVKRFKSQHPELPWSASAADAADEG